MKFLQLYLLASLVSILYIGFLSLIAVGLCITLPFIIAAIGKHTTLILILFLCSQVMTINLMAKAYRDGDWK